jgi:predicted nucleic acid-binding protein
MACVLDASAIIALARNEKDAVRVVGAALEVEKCLVTPPTLTAVYYYLVENDAQARADHWLDFMVAGKIVKLESCSDPQTIRDAAGARRIAKLPLDSLFAAAVAHRKSAPVITALANFEDLAKAGFCRVKWL